MLIKCSTYVFNSVSSFDDFIPNGDIISKQALEVVHTPHDEIGFIVIEFQIICGNPQSYFQ